MYSSRKPAKWHKIKYTTLADKLISKTNIGDFSAPESTTKYHKVLGDSRLRGLKRPKMYQKTMKVRFLAEHYSIYASLS